MIAAKQMKRLLVVLTLLCAACGPKEPEKIPKFHKGQFVKTIMGNHRGQVIWVHQFGNFTYDVRFDGWQVTTDTHTMSPDGPLSLTPMSVIEYMSEFELKEIE